MKRGRNNLFNKIRKKSPNAGKQTFSGAEIILESLIRNNVDVVFGFPGGTVIPLYDVLLNYSDRVRHILVRHEQGAIHAAQAYARVLGKPGVAIGTSGPGAANLITGIMDAHLDSTPLVVIGGQVPTPLIGKDAFQECDMMGMANPITKHNFQVQDVDDLAEVMDQAFYIATTGRPGPVYIDLPKDVQLQQTANIDPGPIDLPFYIASRPADKNQILKAAKVIQSAKRPLFIFGQGAILAHVTKELSDLAISLQIPVTTTILGKGSFDETHPLSTGCIGMHGRRVANYAATHCDVMIAVGCRFSDRVTGEPTSFAEGKKIVHIDIDAYEIDKNVPAYVGLNCDAKEATILLAEKLNGYRGEWVDTWTEKIKQYCKVCTRCVADPIGKALHPKKIMRILSEFLGEDDIVTTGVGQHQMFASHYLTRRKPRTFITSGGAGTMGFGLPASVGAAIAKPEGRVYAIDGDGSFQMTLQELGTLAQNKSKITVIIVDNGYLGMVRQWQELFQDKRYSAVELANNPDFVKIASAYGIDGRFVTDEEGFRQALKDADASGNGFLIHVAVEKESNIMPMVLPGGKLTDFTGYCIKDSKHFFADVDDDSIDSSETGATDEK